MSDGLKQRIVGAIVLGAIGVILLPLLLDFTDPHKIDRSSLIPPAPSIDAVKIVTAKRPAEIKDSSEVDKVFDVSRLQPVKETDTQYHGLDKSGFLSAGIFRWVAMKTKAQLNNSSKHYLPNNTKLF